MQDLKLPIGIQSFRSIREEGYHYVDKTNLVFQLANTGKFIFLSRPRRFGKSLLVNTLRELFLGNRDLFEGLWIEEKWDWQPHHVILIDFNLMEYKQQPLEVAIARQMDQNAENNGIRLGAENFKDKFDELFVRLAADDKKIVVLIDEYEKAITDFLGEDEERMLEHVDILRNFFSVLKSRDADIRFAFLTGVSKIGKLGIFSGLNNLRDISMDEVFATLCGYTQAELESNFPAELEACAQKFRVGREELLNMVKVWYNGYSWDGQTSVYNPFSVLNFLSGKRFTNFWYETGTPTFLVKRLKEGFMLPQELDNLQVDQLGLEAVGTGQSGEAALLFQTGYLTIRAMEETMEPLITLGFPNREVRASFLRHMLSEYTGMPGDRIGSQIVVKMRKALQTNDLDMFFKTARSVFASVPYPVFRTHEDYFHALMHVMLVLTGMKVQAEEMTNVGRMDNVLDTGTHFYIFEYKIDKPAEEALAQIMEKGYQEKLQLHNKPVTLVGVSFGTGERNITEWKISGG